MRIIIRDEECPKEDEYLTGEVGYLKRMIVRFRRDPYKTDVILYGKYKDFKHILKENKDIKFNVVEIKGEKLWKN